MKAPRLAAAVLLALSGLGAPAAEEPKAKPTPPVWHAGLEPACAAARDDGALVLLVFSAQWCGPCQALKAKTLDAPAFRERGGPLHAVRLDIDAHPDTARRFRVNAVPDMLLLTGDGKIVARRSGYADVDGLVAWLAEGRRRAEAGTWLGTAPASEADELRELAAKDKLTDGDWAMLRERLSAADAATRRAAVGAMLALRERAMPLLVSAANDAYLGVRIGATEALARLAPGAPQVDPWAPADKRRQAAQALADWWQKRDALPAPPEVEEADPAVARAIDAAIQALQGDDAVARTDAMSGLVRLGAAALPKLREAIHRSERRGDQRALWAMEDVRWAILVPDAVEDRAGGVRRVLARGTSQERHDATLRLPAAGTESLPALRELVADGDPLVQEGAAQALSKIGGAAAIDAMGPLLRSTDSNVRMTAAQCLGQTGDRHAGKHLVTVLQDPDEVVVCTALAALEEVKASDQKEPLVRCLADTRWRVRAAAAEAIGKLKITESGDALRKLTADRDPFVVKSALEALGALDLALSGKELRALAKRLPALTGYAVSRMLGGDTPATLKGVEELYESASDTVRADILAAAAGTSRGYGRKSDMHWKPLLSLGAQSPDPKLRRLAASTLSGRSSRLAGELVGPLLDDADRDVRIAAAAAVCRIAAHRWGVSFSREDAEQGILVVGPATEGSGGLIRSTLRRGGAGNGNAQPPPTREACLKQHAAWHATLLRHAVKPPHTVVALAIFATGDGKSDLPLLADAVKRETFLKDTEPVGHEAVLPLILRRLPWPEGRGVADAVCAQPDFHAAVFQHHSYANPSLLAYLADPKRVLASLSRGEDAALHAFAGQMLDDPGDSAISLLADSPTAEALLGPMLASKRPVLRAMAVFAHGARGGPTGVGVCRKAIRDADPWIRRSAVVGLARGLDRMEEREELLGPFLRDKSPEVVQVAAVALLAPELRALSRGAYELRKFRYGGRVEVYASTRWSSEQRPPSVLPRRPSFLADARKLFDAGLAAEDDEVSLEPVLALLLAQYGDFEPFHAYAQKAIDASQIRAELVAGISLSRDPRYLPALRSWIEKSKDTSNVQYVLKALRGMEGDAARELRREANRRLRQLAGT